MLSYLIDEGLIWCAFLLGIFVWNKLSLPYRLIAILCGISCFLNIYGYLCRIEGKSNVFAYNFYIIIEAWMLGLAGRLLLKNKRSRIFVLPGLMLFTIPAVFMLITSGKVVMSSKAYIISSVLLSVLYLVILLEPDDLDQTPFFVKPLFYSSFAMVFFFAANIPLFAFYEYTVKHDLPVGFVLIDNIIPVLSNIRYLLIATAFIFFIRSYKIKIKNSMIA